MKAKFSSFFIMMKISFFFIKYALGHNVKKVHACQEDKCLRLFRFVNSGSWSVVGCLNLSTVR
jgi:hypothetical protein